MRVLAYDTYQDPEVARSLGVTYRPLDELLREADFVTLHVALTPETQQLIGARGAEVDEARGDPGKRRPRPGRRHRRADRRIARDGTIGGAALDVTDPEPLPADHPLVFLPNAVVVPHMASATVATRDRMAETAARNLPRCCAGSSRLTSSTSKCWAGEWIGPASEPRGTGVASRTMKRSHGPRPTHRDLRGCGLP